MKTLPWKRITQLGIVFVVLGAGIYDILAITFGSVDSSISRVFLRTVTISPVIAFAIGFVAGHLVWSQPSPRKEEIP